MTARLEVVIVGAGILGAAAAYYLARAGRRVVVLEAREPATGATGNSFAWVNAVFKEPEAYHRLNAAGVRVYPGLAADLGGDVGYRGGGSLEWGGTDEEQATVHARVARLAARGYASRWIAREAALDLEPNIEIPRGVAGVALYEPDGWVDAPCLVRAFLGAAVAHGADVRSGTPARRLVSRGARVERVLTDGAELEAKHVLVCAGTATADLVAPLGIALGVRRVPGLLAVTSPPPKALDRVVRAPGLHLRPDATGGLLLGADDLDGLAGEVSPPPPLAAAALLARARRVFPPAADVAVVSLRIGVRPMPADGVTIAGRVPGIENAWVVVTHSAVTMGPLLGRLAAGEIVGEPPNRLLAPFRPDRFR